MNTSKKSSQIRRAKSTLKSSRKSRYDVDDLETDKENNISDYEGQYQDDVFELNSSSKSSGGKGGFSSIKSSTKQNSKGGGSNIVRTDDIAMGSSLKTLRRINTTMSQESSRMNDSQDLDLENESDEEEEDDSHLTPEQKEMKDRWLQIFHRVSKNRIKQDEAFDFDVQEELQLALYEWKDSGCILECISKLYSLKVDRLSKDAYHLLASIVRGEIGNTKKNDMENEEDANKDQNDPDKKDKNDQKKKILQFEEKQISYGSFDDFNPLCAGQKQIDKPEKFVIEKYDIEFDLDPLFRKKSQYFDDFSSGGLLLNVLNVDRDIQVNLTENDDLIGQTKKSKGNRNSSASNSKRKQKQKCNYLKQLLSEEDKKQYLNMMDGYGIDILPELVDFKMSVIDEITNQLDFDRAMNQQSDNEVKILSQNNRRMEVMEENQNNILNSAMKNENDKLLLNEISSAFSTNSFTQQNAMYRNLSEDSLFQNTSSFNKEDFGQSMFSQNYTPDNSVFKSNKKIRFDDNDQYFESTNDDVYHEDNINSNSETKQINTSQLNTSLHKIGCGDKTIFSNLLLNLNWGDPQQWDIQKLSAAQRKKIRQKKLEESILGEIKEDMEAEEQNEMGALESQFQSLSKPIKYFDFSTGRGKKEEKYEDVIGKRFVRYKQNLDQKDIKIKHRNVIQRDHKILHEKIFKIGLKKIDDIQKTNKNNVMINEFNGKEYENHFDIFQNSQQPRNTQGHTESQSQQYYDTEYEGIGFDDLYDNEMDEKFYNPSKYNNQRDNRIFNNQSDNMGLFELHNNTSSPYKRNQPPQSAYMNSYSFYSQNRTQNFFSQTMRKKPVKIRDLKQTVWQTMTQKKGDQISSQLMPLSQITAQTQPKKGRRRSNNKEMASEDQDAQQIEKAISQIENDEVSLKFSDLMHQLPSYGGLYSQEEGVSIQNCFISLLHLANEKQLRLVDPSHTEKEFFIFLEQPLKNSDFDNSLGEQVDKEQDQK